MLRATALMLLAALLAGSSLWLTWGEKEVTYEDCYLDDTTSRRVCESTHVFAHYDPKALNGRILTVVAVDGLDPETMRGTFWRPYDEPAAGAAWWQSPVLAAARPLLLAGLVAGPVAAGASWSLRATRPRLAPYPALAGAVVLGLGPAAALGGMLLHAATWTASSVEPLHARAGSVFLFGAGFLGLAGGLRLHNLLHDAATGRNGDSPLVPAARLYGFEEGEEEGETEEESSPAPAPGTWRWPSGAALVLAAVFLLLLPLGAPLASKDITVRDCIDHPERGAVCQEESYRVAYFAAHADAWTVHVSDDPVPRTTLTPVADGAGLHYFGAWQDAFPGPAWMGLGALLLAPGVVAAGAWGFLAARGADARRVGWVGLAAAGLLAASFLLTVAAVALQAGTWEGAPAARSQPRLGAWSGLLGLLLLGLWALRLPRPATATATSPPGSEAP